MLAYATIAVASATMLACMKMLAPDEKPWRIAPGFFQFSLILLAGSGGFLSTVLYVSLKKLVVQNLFPEG